MAKITIKYSTDDDGLLLFERASRGVKIRDRKKIENRLQKMHKKELKIIIEILYSIYQNLELNIREIKYNYDSSKTAREVDKAIESSFDMHNQMDILDKDDLTDAIMRLLKGCHDEIAVLKDSNPYNIDTRDPFDSDYLIKNLNTVEKI